MYRAIPCSNKLLSRKWADKEQEIHRRKLQEIRATVEIREPTKFKHLKKKLKKTQMLEGTQFNFHVNEIHFFRSLH